MPWYLYIALKQLFPTGKRVPFFSLVSILGVSLGVMVLLIVLSVMNGFGDKIRETLTGTSGDIRVQGEGILFNWEKWHNKIIDMDFVEGAAPSVDGVLMMKHKAKPAFPGVRGIDLEKEQQVVPLLDYMKEGELGNLDEEGILVGSKLARSINAEIGSTLEVFTPLMLQRLTQEEILLPRELEVVGIFETGWSEVDRNSVLLSMDLMQDLYGMEDGVHGFNLKVKEGVDVEGAIRLINKELAGSGVRARGSLEAHKDFMLLLKIEKTMMFFIIIFVVIVASFSIASSLMTTVVRKTKEIGLLSAMGARMRHVAACYCVQGGIIGVLGTLFGILGALVCLQFRNEIVRGLARWTQRDEVFDRVYYFSEIPSNLLLSDLVIVVVFSVVIATCAGLLPAIRAGRLKPSEALRNE